MQRSSRLIIVNKISLNFRYIQRNVAKVRVSQTATAKYIIVVMFQCLGGWNLPTKLFMKTRRSDVNLTQIDRRAFERGRSTYQVFHAFQSHHYAMARKIDNIDD